MFDKIGSQQRTYLINSITWACKFVDVQILLSGLCIVYIPLKYILIWYIYFCTNIISVNNMYFVYLFVKYIDIYCNAFETMISFADGYFKMY